MNKQLHVVAGIIKNAEGKYLIAKRPDEKHLGGLWEFPGGKRENNESAFEALRRELQEEINIQVIDAKPFLQIEHAYPEKNILLDVWEITDYLGEPIGLEGQTILFIPAVDLKHYAFPAANLNIVEKLLCNL